MNFDWQTVAVALIVAGAFLYVARRGLARLRSFRMSKGGGSCATGCGKCGDVDAPVRQTNAPVQIGESRAAGRGRH
ncbi:MAG: FeoB-associated Cys-rich membrane protein [Acidobacteria bacterium]|nr:FeoB-associated Cys-rich membrane protein [Acidobacteriota bacterium]